MAGTSEGGKKAAQTRGHESLSAAGKKGGEARSKSRSQQGSGGQRGHKDSSSDSKTR